MITRGWSALQSMLVVTYSIVSYRCHSWEERRTLCLPPLPLTVLQWRISKLLRLACAYTTLRWQAGHGLSIPVEVVSRARARLTGELGSENFAQLCERSAEQIGNVQSLAYSAACRERLVSYRGCRVHPKDECRWLRRCAN